jgi:hypothetical protein
MDGLTLEIPLFLFATFADAFVAGLSGFAFGLIAASLWLYFLSPLETATLIVTFGLIVQGYSVWKLRHSLDWRKLWPFLLGATIGVPVGVTLLTWADPHKIRVGVGILLIIYSVYGAKADHGRSSGRPERRILEWDSRRTDWAYRNPGHDMVRPTWLAQGCPTHRVPTSRRFHFRIERAVARRERNPDARNGQIVSDRSSLPLRGNLARIEAFRKIERSGISKARACVVVRLRCGFVFLAG